MLSFLLAIASRSEHYNVFPLLAASLSIFGLPFIKKIRRNLLLKMFTKKGRRGLQDTKGGRILFGLLLSLGTGLLIGLFFGISIGLWVAAGVGFIMLIFFLTGEHHPKTGKYKIIIDRYGKKHKVPVLF